MQDFQRQKVYDSEHLLQAAVNTADETGVRTYEACGSVFEIPVEYKFRNLDDVQDYCNKALASINWEGSPVTVKHAHKNQSKARYSDGSIYLPDRAFESWAWRELVVLHEIAHHISLDKHGEGFAGAMVKLVTEVIGAEMGFLLRLNYLDRGVRLTEYAA